MNYILGIDVGATSLGWCVLQLDKKEKPIKIKRMGVRIFSDGRDSKSQEPLAVTRRNARSARKRRDRLLRRKKRLMKVFIENGLWSSSEAERKNLEKTTDPYEIRCKALDQEVTLAELGRALFHINQRRGFKSNRKTDKKEKDTSALKMAIKDLHERLEKGNYRTIGEYLYKMNPSGIHPSKRHPLRIRVTAEGNKAVYNFYANRKLYEKEVDFLLKKQQAFHPELTDLLCDKIKNIIFYQRPLKPQAVGKCRFEAGEPRAPIASPLYQKFRFLQELNILAPDDLANGDSLTPAQRKLIREIMSKQKTVKFEDIRKELKMSATFNLEDERRKELNGDEVSAILSKRALFGPIWHEINDDQKEEIVNVLLSERNEQDIAEFLLSKFDLSAEQLNKIIDTELPEGYGSLSIKALRKIVPYLEQGEIYSKACELAGYHHSKITGAKTWDYLPYYGVILEKEVIGGSLSLDDDPDKMHKPEIADYERFWGKINNPTVHIGLNQIRLLVNELIRTYGKPKRIAVEFARELKLSRKQKEALNKEQKENKNRNAIINEMLRNAGIKENYENRMIVKIWQDQARENPLERVCPFCGKLISFEKLFTGEFEVEHLLPFSRSYNDGHNNKVISCSSCNRIKTNKTPYEAFGADPRKWNEILERIKYLPIRKQRCFKEDALQGEKEIIERLLNDTKYLAKAAKKYLAAICPPEKISAIPGQLTAQLREAWGLNTLLPDSHKKDRTDHRHHSIDAFVVACTSRAMLQAISAASARGWLERRRLFADSPPPFEDFTRTDMQDCIDKMIISHKPDHGNALRSISENKTIAALHEDTSYGFVKDCDNEGAAIFAIRKPLISLTEDKNIREIASNKIRAMVTNALNGITVKKEREQKLRELAQKYNIRNVRLHIQKNKGTMAPIKDRRTGKIYRYVALGGNYCAEIYQPNRGKYKNKWQVEVISYYHAHQKEFVPKWRKAEPEAKLIMRLFKDDLVAWDNGAARVIMRVKKFNQDGRLFFEPHSVAKSDKDAKATSAKQLQERNARKIKVDILGRVFDPLCSRG